MLAILDGDIIAFRCAATCENEEEHILYSRIDTLIHTILLNVAADEHKIFLSGGTNFRKIIDPEYKGNRKDKAEPIWREAAKEYIQYQHGAFVTDGIEADDIMGIEQMLCYDKSVICSIDKDMLMIPGEHYNWVKDKHTIVTEDEALRFFYRQLLIGDSSDNVKGVMGIGPVKAARIIHDEMIDEREMFDAVRDIYNDDRRLFLNCNLLWIMREPNQQWTYRSYHLLKQEELITLAEEALLPLKQQMHQEDFTVHGSTEQCGIEHGGTKTEPTD